jgi:hypothetical protein
MMADLPIDANERIAEAWRRAEAELKKSLAQAAYSEDWEPYLPTLTARAGDWLDAVAVELNPLLDDEAYRAALKQKAPPQIVQSILPDRGVDMSWRALPEEWRQLSTEQEVVKVGAGLLWEGKPDKGSELSRKDAQGRPACPGCGQEYGPSARCSCGYDEQLRRFNERPRARRRARTSQDWPDGAREEARPEVSSFYGRHGAWERCAPDHVWFQLRFPKNRARARAALLQALQQRADYWLEQREAIRNLLEASTPESRLAAAAEPGALLPAPIPEPGHPDMSDRRPDPPALVRSELWGSGRQQEQEKTQELDFSETKPSWAPPRWARQVNQNQPGNKNPRAPM